MTFAQPWKVAGLLLTILVFLAAYDAKGVSESENVIPKAVAHMPDELQITGEDRYIGDKKAPVQIVEYISMTCPHCADFHNDVLPKIKEKYIDAGKVIFSVREMPWDGIALAVSKILRCAPAEQFFGFTTAFMETQRDWAQSEDALGAIKKISLLGGLNGERVEECLRNEDIHNYIATTRETGLRVLGVRGTPTLFVNGEKIEGAPTFSKLEEAIEKYIK